MRTKALLTALTHIVIGVVATVALLAVLFATGVLVYDGTLVWTRPVFVSETVGFNSLGTDELYPEVSSHVFGISPGSLVVVSLIVAGLFAGLSYALFARRKS